MKEFLKKIHLIDYLTLELDIQKEEFVQKLKLQVDEGSLGIISDSFDVFKTSKNEYKGEVHSNGFKIKRRRKLFDMNSIPSIAEGTYKQNGEQLIIVAEINGFHTIMIFFFIMVVLFYAIFFTSFMFMGTLNIGETFFVIPFLIIHALFMLGIPYFLMRRSVKRMKHDLERELFFIAKK